MIFLNDKAGVLLEQDLTHDQIKPRLLGHWGTCPGLTLVYAHLNRIIAKTGLDALYVVGPGQLSQVCSSRVSDIIIRSWRSRYHLVSLARGLHGNVPSPIYA